MKVHDEFGLKDLDALFYGPVRNVDKITPEVRNDMIEEFRKKYPDFRYDYLKIVTDDKKETTLE